MASEKRPQPRRRADNLDHISEADYINPTREREAALSAEIDRYFNTPLVMFPFAEHSKKPDRFYDFYEQTIAERFPDDQDIRDCVSDYGRRFFSSLVGYVAAKRGLLLLALIGISLTVAFGPALFVDMGLKPGIAMLAAGGAMLLILPIWAGINALVFTQYRISLENRSFELSRQIIQRTRELQNLYANLRAQPDQEETRYQAEGDEWGKRSAYLVRMLMWVAQRMEYLEKFIQVEMWRLRRERYWTNWVGGFAAVIVVAVWAVAHALQPVPGVVPAGAAVFRAMQGIGLLIGLGLGWASYNFWKTPLNIARDKLGAEGWVRYATLDLDNTIGDQVSRDKKRLVEYRTLNKGR